MIRVSTCAVAAATLLACAPGGASRPLPAAREGLDEAGLSAGCARGLAVDCRTLGRARLGGEDLPRDDRLAASELMLACELGDPAACGDLGVLYAVGRGLPQSDERAAALSRRACEQGAAIACSNHAALLAEGAVPDRAAETREARAARILRAFRTACDAGVPEGCTNLGAALEGGELAVSDPRAAARAHRRACDAGLALACHRLALLVSERPEVAPDLTATALQARACRAAVAPACFAVSERVPEEGARTPAARLVDERTSFALGVPGTGGFSPGELSAVRAAGPRRNVGDVRSPPQATVDAVPEGLRARLRLDLPPRADPAGDAAVERLVALRRHQLGQCHEAPRAAGAPAADGYATFFVDGDGRPIEVRAATTTGDAPLEACLAELVTAWEFPGSPRGVHGPFLARHAFDAAAADGAPGYAGPGALRPAQREPGCVERRLAVPAEYRTSTGSVTVKLAVDRAGAPALVHALTPAPEPILAAVADAVRRCAWSPGADSDGRAATLWLTLTVNLAAR